MEYCGLGWVDGTVGHLILPSLLGHGRGDFYVQMGLTQRLEYWKEDLKGGSRTRTRY